MRAPVGAAGGFGSTVRLRRFDWRLVLAVLLCGVVFGFVLQSAGSLVLAVDKVVDSGDNVNVLSGFLNK